MTKSHLKGSFRRLTPEEIEALREEMRQASVWAKEELKRRRQERDREANQNHQDSCNRI